jgi:hypothetical protein
MTTTINLVALDPRRGETYEIDSRATDGFRHGVVTGQFGSISGDPVALNELADALKAAATGAVYAHALRVDEPGVLPVDLPGDDLLGDELPHETGNMTPASRAVAGEAHAAVAWVWACGGEELPVEPGDWTADEEAAIALVDDFTELHFTLDDEVLTARSRCPHDHIHDRTVEHPRDLETVRGEAEQCTGHPGEDGHERA